MIDINDFYNRILARTPQTRKRLVMSMACPYNWEVKLGVLRKWDALPSESAHRQARGTLQVSHLATSSGVQPAESRYYQLRPLHTLRVRGSNKNIRIKQQYPPRIKKRTMGIKNIYPGPQRNNSITPLILSADFCWFSFIFPVP